MAFRSDGIAVVICTSTPELSSRRKAYRRYHVSCTACPSPESNRPLLSTSSPTSRFDEMHHCWQQAIACVTFFICNHAEGEGGREGGGGEEGRAGWEGGGEVLSPIGRIFRRVCLTRHTKLRMFEHDQSVKRSESQQQTCESHAWTRLEWD